MEMALSAAPAATDKEKVRIKKEEMRREVMGRK
jgi:hypothetical protein